MPPKVVKLDDQAIKILDEMKAKMTAETGEAEFSYSAAVRELSQRDTMVWNIFKGIVDVRTDPQVLKDHTEKIKNLIDKFSEDFKRVQGELPEGIGLTDTDSRAAIKEYLNEKIGYRPNWRYWRHIERKERRTISVD